MAEELHWVLRIGHIVVGSVGLLLFWIAAIAKKGGCLHIKAGRAFGNATYVLLVTIAISCGWGLMDVESFADGMVELNDEVRLQIRFFLLLFVVLSVFLLSAVEFGVRSVRAITEGDKVLRTGTARAVIVVEIVLLFVALSMLINDFVATGWRGLYWVPMVLGVLALLDCFGNWSFGGKVGHGADVLMTKHVEAMIGCGIAYHTALSVTVFSRLAPGIFEGVWVFVPWVLPTMVGVPLSVLVVRRWGRGAIQ